MFRKHFVTIFVLMLAGCNAPQNSAPAARSVQADEASINKLRGDFLAAFNAGDAARVADLYTVDAVVMPQNQPAMTGHDAIVTYNKGLFDNFNVKMSLSSNELKVFGDIAFDRGTYILEITPKAGGSPITDDGKYLVISQHQADDSWKVIRDIDNSSKPLPPAPATGK